MKTNILTGIVFVLSFYTAAGQTNGTYCADVERYNPSTSQESTYRLTVGVENKKIVRLDWPNGGHSDLDDFAAAGISNNKSSFKDYNGIQFKITLLQKGTACFNDVPKARQCIAYTQSGRRCKNKTDNWSGKCWRHG